MLFAGAEQNNISNDKAISALDYFLKKRFDIAAANKAAVSVLNLLLPNVADV